MRRRSAILHPRHPHPLLVSLLALTIATAVSIWVAEGAGLNTVGAVFARVRPEWLLVVAAAQLVALLGYVLTYRVVGAMGGTLRLAPPLALRLVAAGFGAFTIGGGFALDYRALDCANANRRDARIRVLALGSLEYAVLAPAACISAVVLVLEGAKVQDSLLWPWIIAVPIGFALALPLASRRGRSIVGGRRGPRERIEEALQAINMWRQFRTDPTRTVEAVLGMTLYWAAEIVSLWAALETFSTTIALPALIVAYATGYAATRRTLPLGGAGATELLMTYALHWVGLSIPAAFAGVVVYRFFNFVLVTPPALQAGAALERELGDTVQTATAASG